jgi:hypothetical protein
MTNGNNNNSNIFSTNNLLIMAASAGAVGVFAWFVTSGFKEIFGQGPPPPPSPSTGGNGVDQFGVTKIYATKLLGKEHFAQWGSASNPIPQETIMATNEGKQSADQWCRVTGSGSITLMGDGTARCVGGPRVHFIDPNAQQTVPPPQVSNWGDFEMTGYFKVVGFANTNGNCRTEGRIYDYGPLIPPGNCVSTEFNAAGSPLGASYNTAIKETGVVGILQRESIDHGAYTNGEPSFHPFPGATIIPRNKWFGVKLIVRSLPNTNPTYKGQFPTAVIWESWMDVNGDNNWVKMSSNLDDGSIFARRDPSAGVNYQNCPDRPLNMPLTLPTPDVRWAFDNATECYLKNLSIREI